jgi:hypothetical protein
MANPVASRSPLDTRLTALVGVAVLLGIVLACTPATTPSERPPVAATPAPVTPTATQASAGPSATSAVATGGPSPTIAGRDAPPDAFLAAEGGDPIPGQLGTYVWLESGSDAPWLPGAPIAVGTAEPLTVSLVPDGDIRAWSARYVPANAAGPDAAAPLGEGAGQPAFAAPGPGTWTVELFVEFAPAVGNAHYFWRLEVE